MSQWIDHLERNLGEMTGGSNWEGIADKAIVTARFEDHPWEGSVTHATVGMSRCPFLQEDGQKYRQELMISVWKEWERDLAAGLAATEALILKNHRPLLWGELFFLEAPVVEGAQTTSFLCAPPLHLDEDFEKFEGDSGTVEIGWLIPVRHEEIALIQAIGGDGFLELVDEQDIDILDLGREAVRPANGSQ